MDDLPASRRIVGTKQVVKAALANKLSIVYIAEDADDVIKRKVTEACGGETTMKFVPTMLELGEMCCIDIGAACAGVLIE